jgi:hypothetical protein
LPYRIFSDRVLFTANDFTWIPTFEEIARELVKWEGRQGELIAFLEKLRQDGFIITPLNDKDDKGARFLVKEIDPFTFLGVFNRGIRKDQRFVILAEVIKFFGLDVSLPKDFSGVPLLNNQKSWLFAYQPGRGVNDVKRLWTVFKLALLDNQRGRVARQAKSFIETARPNENQRTGQRRKLASRLKTTMLVAWQRNSPRNPLKQGRRAVPTEHCSAIALHEL